MTRKKAALHRSSGMLVALLALALAACPYNDFDPEPEETESSGSATPPGTDPAPIDPVDDPADDPSQDTDPEPADSCGGCDDGDPCTNDRCSDGTCAHEAIAEAILGCSDDMTLLRCDDGAQSEVDCLAACISAGYDAFGGCSETDAGCRCGNVLFDLCEPGNESCITMTDVAVCESAAELGTESNLWRVYDCNELCAAEGFGPAVSCEVDYRDPTKRICYCEERCDPECPEGAFCYFGQCYAIPYDDPADDTLCGADWQCGYREACEGGECVPVECTSDVHCGWCEQCYNHYCYDCGLDADNECACY